MHGEVSNADIEKKSDFKEQGAGKDLRQFDARIPAEKIEYSYEIEHNQEYDSGEKIKSKEKTENESLDKLTADYLDDIKAKSDCPQTIPDEPFKSSELRKVSSEVNQKMRSEFNSHRENLIREWEAENDMEWPTYKENVLDANGNTIRFAGDRYDAHHIQPLSLGGKNEASNITPLRAEVHYDRQGVHAPGSPYDKIDSYLKEQR